MRIISFLLIQFAFITHLHAMDSEFQRAVDLFAKQKEKAISTHRYTNEESSDAYKYDKALSWIDNKEQKRLPLLKKALISVALKQNIKDFYSHIPNVEIKIYSWVIAELTKHGDCGELTDHLAIEFMKSGIETFHRYVLKYGSINHSFIVLADKKGVLHAFDPYFNFCGPLSDFWNNKALLGYFRTYLEKPDFSILVPTGGVRYQETDDVPQGISQRTYRKSLYAPHMKEMLQIAEAYSQYFRMNAYFNNKLDQINRIKDIENIEDLRVLFLDIRRDEALFDAIEKQAELSANLQKLIVQPQQTDMKSLLDETVASLTKNTWKINRLNDAAWIIFDKNDLATGAEIVKLFKLAGLPLARANLANGGGNYCLTLKGVATKTESIIERLEQLPKK